MTDGTKSTSCQDCQFYRTPNRVPAALQQALNCRKDQSQILQEIRKMHDDQRAAEFDQWVELSFSEVDDARWEARPAASPYCGVEEAASVPNYFLAEVRNAGGACDKRPSEPLTPHTCETCRYVGHPHGDEEDDREIAVSLRLAALGDSGEVPRLFQRISDNQAEEIRTAYRGAGDFARPPRYLDYCNHATAAEPGKAVCAVKNPDNRCPFWEKPDAPGNNKRQEHDS